MGSDDNSEFKIEPPVMESVDDSLNGEIGVLGLSPENIDDMAGRLLLAEAGLALLIRDLTFQEFIRELLVSTMKVIRCEASSVLEVNREKGVIFFRAASGHSSDQIVKFVIPLGSGIVGQVVDSRQAVLISNIEENQTHLREFARSVGFDVRDMIAGPILVRGEIYGVIELINKSGSDGFTEADLRRLERACEILGKTIEIRMMMTWAKKNAPPGPTQ